METTNTNTLRPTFSSSFHYGWDVAFGSNFLVLFLVVILVGIISGPSGFMQFNFDPEDFSHGFNHMHLFDAAVASLGILAALLALFALAYALLLVPIFEFGAKLMFVEAARGNRPNFDTLIKGFRENYLHIILANLLIFALIGMAFIALIIPGIIVACRLTFVPYLVMDKKLDPIAAVEESWRMTRGHAWTIFFMALTSIFIIFLGALLLIVGIIPAMVWVKSSFASLYHAVSLEKEQAVVVE